MGKPSIVINSRILLFILSSLALSACAVPPRAIITQVAKDERSFITSSAETSTTYLKTSDDNHHYCAGVSPDATYSESKSGGFSLNFLNLGGASPSNEAFSEENSGDEMVGRTPALLLAREIFYRACEMSENAGLNSDQQLDLFLRSMDMAVDLLKNETQNTTIGITTNFSSTRTQNLLSKGASDTSQTATSLPSIQPSDAPPYQSDDNAARSDIYGYDDDYGYDDG
jgi:hypothetical protein